MSVKLREAAAAKLPLGALNPARLWPLAGDVYKRQGRDITSLNAPWYSARSTERGDYASGMFVPALEGCKLVLQYEDVKVEIPLALKQESL